MINNENYKEIFSKDVHLIEVAGDQCAGCAAMNPLVSELAKKYNINHYYINVTHTNYKFIEDYNVSKIPTILLIADGKLLGSVSGYQPPEILEIWFEDKIQNYKK